MKFDLSYLQPKERASFGLRALYEAAGCRKYHMGRFEEYGLYQENRSFLSSEQVITFTDLDGRLLALKPDVTLSIAKTAQPAAGETLKYYYHENVYRPSAESHTFKEISQMGLEMLGAVGEAQVQQTVRLAAQSLGQMGAAWVLEVSHMGYLFGLFDALGVPDAARAKLLEKLREKNAHELRAAAGAAGLADAADTLCSVLNLCADYFHFSAILTDGFIELWSTLRFVFLGCIVFLALAVLYGLAQETRSVHYVWPGVLFSLTAWMVLSLLFSLYVENAANYSVIYGSIGAIIVLLLWLYLSATMMIMGAEFNSVLMEMKTARG